MFFSGARVGWNTLAIGAGGLADGFDIAPDGTAIARTDSAFLFKFSGKLPADFTNPNHRWIPVVTAQSMPGKYMRAPGVFEAVIAHSKPTNFNMIAWNNADTASNLPDAFYVYYSRNAGETWTASNLKYVADSANEGGTTRKASTRKMQIDPNNENFVIVGLPPNAATSTGLISNGTGASTGTVISIFSATGTFQPGAYVFGGIGGTNYGYLSAAPTINTSTSWSIAGTTLTISDASPQTFSVGQGLQSSGAAITANTIITASLGSNQYTVNNSQTVTGSGTLTGRKATLVGTAVLTAAGTLNFTTSISGGDVSSVYVSTDGGATYSPIAASTMGITTVQPGVSGIMFDKNSGTVTGAGGLTVTKKAFVPVGGADIYGTTDGGVTWPSTGFATACGTTNFSVFYGVMNHSGHYFVNATVSGVASIWRYSDVTTPGTWVWDKLTNVGTKIAPHSVIFCDPRAGHESYLSFADVNAGPLLGWTSNSATATPASSVLFGRVATTGNNLPAQFAASYDVPWLNHGLGNQAGGNVGANWIKIDDNGNCWWSGAQGILWLFTQSDFSTPAIPDFSVSCNTWSVALSRGSENTVSEFVCRPPDSPYPIKCIQDMGLHVAGPDSYATDYYMDSPAINALGYGQNQRIDAWNASYAPGNPSFVVAKLSVAGFTGSKSNQQVYSGYSTNSGQQGTWTPYAQSPEAAYAILTGETTHILGGFICTIDEQHQMCCMGVNLANTPIYTANQGTSWNFCGNLPSVNWWGHYYVFGNQPPGQPFAAGQGTRIGTAWALEAMGSVNSTGVAKVWKSTDGCATFSLISTINSFGSVYLSPQIYSVPGHDDDLWITASFLSATSAGLWRSVNGGANFTQLATLPTGFPQYFTLGKPFPGDTYPALYIAMWSAANDFSTTLLYYSRDVGATWNMVGPTGSYLDMPPNMSMNPVKGIFGDWEIPGVIYASSAGSGFSYYRIPY